MLTWIIIDRDAAGESLGEYVDTDINVLFEYLPALSPSAAWRDLYCQPGESPRQWQADIEALIDDRPAHIFGDGLRSPFVPARLVRKVFKRVSPDRLREFIRPD